MADPTRRSGSPHLRAENGGELPRPGVKVPRSVGRGAALRVAVTCGSCKATAMARTGGRVVAKTSKRISGSAELKLRPKRLRGARRLSEKVTVTPDGGAAMTVTRSVRLRR